MTENPVDTLSAPVAAQLAEAMQSEPGIEPVKPRTIPVTWRGRTWQVRSKPGAVFLDRYESGKIMKAVESVIGEKQYAAILGFDPDLDGPGGVEEFIAACNKAWGIDEGN